MNDVRPSKVGILVACWLAALASCGPEPEGEDSMEETGGTATGGTGGAPIPCTDADGDGWPIPPGTCESEPPFDCDPFDPRRFPGAPELCNGIDDDCDDLVDEDEGAPACALSCAAPATGCDEAAELAVAGRGACLRTASGTVFCWGATFADPELPVAPFLIPVPNVTRATKLIGTACAAEVDRVVCWDGVPHPYEVPLTPDAVSFAIRTEGLCAVTSAGAVSCNPTAYWLSEPSTPFASGVGSLTSDCELNTNGSVHCAGVVSSGFTFDVELIASGATLLAEGDGSVCAIVAGELRCWEHDTLEDPDEGRLISGFGAATALSIGHGYRCALGATGNVACWEGNVPDGLPPARQIGAGTNFACILAEDGRVLCWGRVLDGVPSADAVPTLEPQEPARARSLEPRDSRMMFGTPRLGACDNMSDYAIFDSFSIEEVIEATDRCASALDPEACFRDDPRIPMVSEPCLACLRTYAVCSAPPCYPTLVACAGFPPDYPELRVSESSDAPESCFVGCEGKKRLGEACMDASECLSDVCDSPPTPATTEDICRF